MRVSFCLTVSFFIAASRLRAELLSGVNSMYTAFTGSLPRVYLAPLPLLCSESLLLKSYVHPVYSVPSEHEGVYTQGRFSFFILFYTQFLLISFNKAIVCVIIITNCLKF